MFLSTLIYSANSCQECTETTTVGPSKCLFYTIVLSGEIDYRLSNAIHCIYFIGPY